MFSYVSHVVKLGVEDTGHYDNDTNNMAMVGTKVERLHVLGTIKT